MALTCIVNLPPEIFVIIMESLHSPHDLLSLITASSAALRYFSRYRTQVFGHYLEAAEGRICVEVLTAAILTVRLRKIHDTHVHNAPETLARKLEPFVRRLTDQVEIQLEPPVNLAELSALDDLGRDIESTMEMYSANAWNTCEAMMQELSFGLAITCMPRSPLSQGERLELQRSIIWFEACCLVMCQDDRLRDQDEGLLYQEMTFDYVFLAYIFCCNLNLDSDFLNRVARLNDNNGSILYYVINCHYCFVQETLQAWGMPSERIFEDPVPKGETVSSTQSTGPAEVSSLAINRGQVSGHTLSHDDVLDRLEEKKQEKERRIIRSLASKGIRFLLGMQKLSTLERRNMILDISSQHSTKPHVCIPEFWDIIFDATFETYMDQGDYGDEVKWGKGFWDESRMSGLIPELFE